MRADQPGNLNPQLILNFARDNKADFIEMAVTEGGVPVDYANQIGQTALHIAALHGHLEAAAVLLDLGMDVNRPNFRGTTPLHFAAAAHKNPRAICELLLDRGADTGISDMSGRLPYEMASDDAIRALLDGPDPRLFEFAERGNLEGLRALFAEDPEMEPGVFNQEGKAPIHLAAARGHMGVVNYLLERGAFIDMQDFGGNTVAHHAVREGHAALLTLLIRKGADLSVQNFKDSEYATGNWLSGGEQLGPLHQTPLHLAVEIGDAQLAGQLLGGGAPVGMLDFDKKTAVHTALEMGDEECAELLLQHGADPSQGCKDFATPLHLVAARGMQPLLELLLSKGADPSAADEQGWTPLMLAVRAGKLQAARALLAAGADAAAANAQGSTAAHLAAVNGKLEMCRLLAEACPAALRARNAAGALPAEVAKTPEVAAVLAPLGAPAAS